ncbi:response regulator transcription factor [Paenibacillus sp. 481]|uniref:response regulator transcription factor n=1 Tax=Paenibacillus sp. 481 TaxID=2835869 RepID=UPI001E33C2CD|nr:response regulator transcription factor [Paenibacillus sp. 481]UHA73250.1 response regulator transcription factor [Paenibacillus sp. 481]
MNKQILLVEDDPYIAEMVKDHLKKDGFTIRHASDGEQAVHLFKEKAFDLIVLDLMLPDMDGLEFLQRIRASSYIPVLIMSAKDSDVDKALGLGFGADDYIAKPFSLIELTARVKAVLRRATHYTQTVQAEASNMLHIHELTLDLDHFSARKKGEEIKLTPKEWHILKLLMENPRRAFSKEQIYRAVWNDEYYADENAIQVHISRLREKIETDPASPQYIKTVWGIGYKVGAF